MQFKNITTQLSGRFLNIDLPDKKSIILNGDIETKEYLLQVIKSLLCFDYSTELSGFLKHNPLETKSVLVFTNGIVRVHNQASVIEGNVPKLHILELQSDGSILSVLTSEDSNNLTLDTDMTKYSGQLPLESMYRLASLCNKVAGYEFVVFENNEINFNWESTISKSVLETIYLTISESFLTPEGYLRLVLLHTCFGMDSSIMAKLIEVLDNIRGLEMLFCTAEIEPQHLSSDSVVTYLNV